MSCRQDSCSVIAIFLGFLEFARVEGIARLSPNINTALSQHHCWQGWISTEYTSKAEVNLKIVGPTVLNSFMQGVERWTSIVSLTLNMKLSSPSGGELQILRFKYTWVEVWVHPSKLERRGVHEHELRCTWVETAQVALSRQVLRSGPCEAEENSFAKCTKECD